MAKAADQKANTEAAPREDAIREGSAPNFCPPTEEGITISLQDEHGDELTLEFLGLLLEGDHSYGFFFPLDDGAQPLESGEVLLLEVTDTDEDGQPSEFELVEDEHLAVILYEKFQQATRDLYKFA